MTSRYTWMLPTGCFYVPKSESRPLPSEAVEAPIIKLRRGGSIQPIIRSFGNSKLLQITGPPGCGKSTKVPAALAADLRTVVLHLVPHPMQVVQIATTLGKGNLLRDMNLLFNSCSQSGVMVMTYTTLISYIIRKNKSFGELDRSLLLYCDESHESDAATYSFIRYIASGLCECRAALVSATLDGQEFAVEEGFGTIADVHGESLDVSNLTKLVSKLSKGKSEYKVLYFSDSRSERQKCVKLFSECGYTSFELDSRVEPGRFEEVLVSNRQRSFWFCAVDSSYRTGFNFELDCVLDSCAVSYKSIVDGSVKARMAFNFECYQAKGRLGRSQYTEHSVYVTLGRKSEDLIARVEGIEMANACLLLRTQGLLDTRLSIRSLDRTRYLLKDMSLVDGARTVVELPDSEYFTESDVARKVKRRVNGPSSSARAYGSSYNELIDALTLDVPKITVKEEVGGYYCLVGDMQLNDRSPGFPGGQRSVMRLVENGQFESRITSLSSMDVQFATKVLTNKLCEISMRHHASMGFLQETCDSKRSVNVNHLSYLQSFRDGMAVYTNEYSLYAKLVNRLIDLARVEVVNIADSEFACYEAELKSAFLADLAALDNSCVAVPVLSVKQVHSSVQASSGLPAVQQSRLTGPSGSQARMIAESDSSSTGSTSSSFWRVGAKRYDANLGKLIDPYKTDLRKPD